MIPAIVFHGIACCVALLYISSFIVQNKFHTEVQRRKAKIVTTFRCEKKLS